MASIKELHWGIALAVTAVLGCSSGNPSQSSTTCPNSAERLCPNDSGQSCTDVSTDNNNCGSCGVVCGGGKSCKSGSCSCVQGQKDCNGTCKAVNTADNCGACDKKCQGDTPMCSGGKCVSESDCADTVCGSSCVDTNTTFEHCGSCDKSCTGNQTCENGECKDPDSSGTGGTTSKGGASNKGGTSSKNSSNAKVGGTSSVDTSENGGASDIGGTSAKGGATSKGGTSNKGGTSSKAGASSVGGTSSSTAATGGAGNVPVRSNGCAVPANMISDFEEGAGTPVVLAQDGHTGEWEAFNDGTVMDKYMAVEESGTAECNKYALHAKGRGFSSWGAGVGLILDGTLKAPKAYDAASHKFVGISFKAKNGGTQGASPVRFNISTPMTEKSDSGGTCTETKDSSGNVPPEKACYNHIGRFLYQENALTSDWQTFTFCFDRDLYPLFLPSNLSNADRDSVAAKILKLQFQFNNAKDLSNKASDGSYAKYPTNLQFDFWVDDLKFVTECPSKDFESNGSPKQAFPQNAKLGSCEAATNASNFSGPISEAYARWTKNFVRTDGSNLKIIAPEQSGITTSEAMGYGLMIAAAMGDKTSFDKFWGFIKGHLDGGLMDWKSATGNNSATDGDEDIAYGLLMADLQWGGTYKDTATSMINAIAEKDVSGSRIKLGSQWDPGFNPSYFAPAAYRAFAPINSKFTSVISDGYTRVGNNVNATTKGLPTDWCDLTTTCAPKTASEIGAQVTANFNKAVFGYDAARVPWRVGLDVCKTPAGGGADVIKAIVSFMNTKYASGIDLLQAGLVKSTGAAAVSSSDGATAALMQASFIGSVGVAAMAEPNKVMRDRAFRTVLDILENGEFNSTYFPATVGMLTLLAMSGNFPTP